MTSQYFLRKTVTFCGLIAAIFLLVIGSREHLRLDNQGDQRQGWWKYGIAARGRGGCPAGTESNHHEEPF